MDDLFRLLVCFTDDVLTHALCVDQCTLEHFTVCLKALQLLVQLLVFSSQIRNLLAKLFRLCIVLLQLFFHLGSRGGFFQIAQNGHPAESA